MEDLYISQKREDVFSPLLEWGILGVEEIGELSGYQGNNRNLKKLILRAENDGILNSFIHKMSSRKFIYLTRKAHQHLSVTPWNVKEDIKMHDSILNAVLYRFSKMDFVSLHKINNQDLEFNQGIFADGVDPDGMIRAKLNDRVLNVAIEIELTRKNSTVITEKFKKYHRNTSFDVAIYFFNSLRVMAAYSKYYEEIKKFLNISNDEQKLIFCCSKRLAEKDFNPLEAEIRNNGPFKSLKEFFNA